MLDIGKMPGPHFSPGGGMVAQDFGRLKVFAPGAGFFCSTRVCKITLPMSFAFDLAWFAWYLVNDGGG